MRHDDQQRDHEATNSNRPDEERAGDSRSQEFRALAEYFKQLGARPPLSREEESRHATTLQASREAFAALVQELTASWSGFVLDEAAGDPKLGRKWPLEKLEACYAQIEELASSDDDPRLQEIVRQGRLHKRRIEHARDELVVTHLPFVVHVVRRFNNFTIPFMDLVQEGNIGLMEAADRFEPERGHRFATYAIWWIRRALSAAYANQSRVIRVPSHVRDRSRELARVTSELRELSGHTPSPREIAMRMGLPVDKVKELQTLVQDAQPLETPGDDRDAPGPLYSLPDLRAENPLESTLNRELRGRLLDALRCLDPREEKVIKLRFGLSGASTLTLREVGRVLRLSRERVRQIELSALARIRALLEEPQVGADLAAGA